MSVRRGSLFILVSAYLVLWVGGVGPQLFSGRAAEGAGWAAPTFLLLAGLIVLTTTGSSDLIGLLAIAGLGFAAEVIGVRHSFLFGAYRYTGTLQPQWLGVPLVMASAWMVMAAYVKQMLLRLQLPGWIAVVAAGAWMAALDLVIDPLAANQLNYWRWMETGSYYGIPTHNFIGWFSVSLLIFGLIRRRWQPNPWARYVGLSVLLFFTLLAFTYRLLLAGSIGSLLMLIQLILSLRLVRTELT